MSSGFYSEDCFPHEGERKPFFCCFVCFRQQKLIKWEDEHSTDLDISGHVTWQSYATSTMHFCRRRQSVARLHLCRGATFKVGVNIYQEPLGVKWNYIFSTICMWFFFKGQDRQWCRIFTLSLAQNENLSWSWAKNRGDVQRPPHGDRTKQMTDSTPPTSISAAWLNCSLNEIHFIFRGLMGGAWHKWALAWSMRCYEKARFRLIIFFSVTGGQMGF